MNQLPAADPDRRPSLPSRLAHWVIFRIWKWQGWTIHGHAPDVPKAIVAGAPHSSNWDFVFFVGATHEEGMEPGFLGKQTLFRGIMRKFMFDMGGVPVDRSRRANLTEQVAEAFDRVERLHLVIAPEGSRTSDGTWRSGFYHMARAAGVPIIPVWVDNPNRRMGFGDPIDPQAPYSEVLLKIALFLRSHLPDFERYQVLERQALDLANEGR